MEEGNRPLRTRLEKEVRAARTLLLDLPGNLISPRGAVVSGHLDLPQTHWERTRLRKKTASGVAKILSLALSAEGIEVRGWGEGVSPGGR